MGEIIGSFGKFVTINLLMIDSIVHSAALQNWRDGMSIRLLSEHREKNIREVKMPDGSITQILMSADLWRLHDAVKLVEGINESDIAAYALEEAELQNITFEEAYRACTAFLAERWTP